MYVAGLVEPYHSIAESYVLFRYIVEIILMGRQAYQMFYCLLFK